MNTKPRSLLYTLHSIHLLEVLRVQNTGKIALSDSLERQGGNQRSTDTASIFSSQNLHRIFLFRIGLGRPIKDLTESLGATRFEMRILVENGTVGANVARLQVLLGADGGDTTGGETSSACAN
jgi:hypothetical protein